LRYNVVADSVVIQIFVVGSERRTCFERECVMPLQGHPRSLILAPIKSAYAISYWSSTVTSSGLILSRFRDIAGFLRERPHPYSTRILGVFPLH